MPTAQRVDARLERHFGRGVVCGGCQRAARVVRGDQRGVVDALTRQQPGQRRVRDADRDVDVAVGVPDPVGGLFEDRREAIRCRQVGPQAGFLNTSVMRSLSPIAR